MAEKKTPGTVDKAVELDDQALEGVDGGGSAFDLGLTGAGPLGGRRVRNLRERTGSRTGLRSGKRAFSQVRHARFNKK